MKQKTKISYLAVIVLSLALGLASFSAVAKSDNAKNDNAKNDKSSKVSQSQTVANDKSANLKNFAKPDTTKGETNAQIHKEKNEKVVKELEKVATQEKSAGNTEISNQIEQVVQEQEQIQEQAMEAISEVEDRGKVKTFLLGTDYKNLGQLRSNLVQNRNQIRKLTQTMSQVQNEGEQTLLQAQLETLMQERERIKTVITTNESGFSLFGWVSRFLTNYEQTPINEAEEDELVEEVEEAIEVAVENQEVAQPIVPAETTVPTPAPATTEPSIIE